MKLISHLHLTRPVSPEKAATSSAVEGIYRDYRAMKEAAKVLRDCRIETECFLQCKRGAVAISLAGRFVKRVLMSLAGIGGGIAGSILPGVGSFAGGVLAVNAVDTLVPGYNLVPNTDLEKRIDEASRGVFGKYFTSDYYVDEARGLFNHELGNRLINGSLEAAGTATPPASVPVVWLFNNGKDLLEVSKTSKLELVRQLQVSLWKAEHVIEELHARFSAAFRLHRKFEQHYSLLGEPMGKGYGVKVRQKPSEWVRESAYIKHHGKTMNELERLKRLVSDSLIKLNAPV